MVVVESRKMARLKGFYPIMGIQNYVLFLGRRKNAHLVFIFSLLEYCARFLCTSKQISSR